METYRQRRCGKGGGYSGHVFSAGSEGPQLIVADGKHATLHGESCLFLLVLDFNRIFFTVLWTAFYGSLLHSWSVVLHI